MQEYHKKSAGLDRMLQIRTHLAECVLGKDQIGKSKTILSLV